MNQTPYISLSPDMVTWPHTVLSFLPPDIPIGIHSAAEWAEDNSKLMCAAAQAAAERAHKLNETLMHSKAHGTVLCPDFLVSLGSRSSINYRADLWRAIHGTRNCQWILPTYDPEDIPVSLPVDWHELPSNICVATVLDGSQAGPNQMRTIELRKVQSRNTAVWLRAPMTLDLLDDIYDDLGEWLNWVIADTATATPASPQDVVDDWVGTIRDQARSLSKPFFYLAPMNSHKSAADGNPSIAEHPFPRDLKIDLRQVSIGTDPVQECPPPATAPAVETPTTTPPVEAPSPKPSKSSRQSKSSKTASDTGKHVSADTTVAAISPDEDTVAKSAETIVPTKGSPPEIIPEVVVPEIKDGSSRFMELNTIVQDGLRASHQAGLALREIRDHKLWRNGGFTTWNSYCDSILETDRSYINKIIRGAGFCLEISNSKPPLSPDGTAILPVNEAQTRLLAKLRTPEQRVEAWKTSVNTAIGMPTAKGIEAVVRAMIAGLKPTVPPSKSRAAQRKDLVNQLRQMAAEGQSGEPMVQLIDELLTLL